MTGQKRFVQEESIGLGVSKVTEEEKMEAKKTLDFVLRQKTKISCGGQGSGDVSGHEFHGNQYSDSLSTKTYQMTDSMKMPQRQRLSESIIERFPPKDQWKDGRAYEIAEIAAHSFSSNGTQLVTADDKDGKVAGLISFYVDPDGVNITYLASTGQVHHVGTDLLKKSIDMNPGKDVNLYADPGAKTYYGHLGMHLVDDGGEGRGATYHWSADEAQKFSSIPKETMNTISRILSMIPRRLVHGGEGSGEHEGHEFRGNQWSNFPRGNPKMSKDHISPKYPSDHIKDNEADANYAYNKMPSADNWESVNQGIYTEDEYSSVRGYTGTGGNHSSQINNGLRNGDKNSLAKNDFEIYKDDIKNIDLAISKSELPEGLVLYRSVNMVAVLKSADIDEIKEGTVIKDKGFMSTSTNIEETKFFGGFYKPKGYDTIREAVFVIRTKEGMTGAKSENEHEIILPRDSVLKCTGIKDDGKTMHIIMDYQGVSQ
jgi:hypothetical protein